MRSMRNHPAIQLLLTPLSWVYGLSVAFRNYLFDKGILRSFSSPIPLVVVGNLIAGGTGKTPVVAWLSAVLGSQYRLAVLSRGYGRRSLGFQLAGSQPDPRIIGDEPAELKMLLPGTLIAVDRNRRRGIRKLASGSFGPVDLILMDDGFQHRQIRPGLSIILDDATRPMRFEKLLPAGLRRESLNSLKRADLVVRTRIPGFTYPKAETGSGNFLKPVILVTGIANPQPLVDHISLTHKIIRHLSYTDHHRYTAREATFIASLCSRTSVPPYPILTTGKDYVKLIRFPELRDLGMETIPARTGIDPAVEKEIVAKIVDYVEKNRSNG